MKIFHTEMGNPRSRRLTQAVGCIVTAGTGISGQYLIDDHLYVPRKKLYFSYKMTVTNQEKAVKRK
jgi:hypothetical protein